jgi:DNA helicase-2/ATP-dependent DNA helicase PcrA
MAVLIRSGWHSNDLEVQLQAASIPFVKFGGFKFMESSHIKDVIAYLKIAHNPLDSVSWNRCLLSLDGLGPKAAGDVIADLLSSKAKDPQAVLAKLAKRMFYPELAALFQLVFGSSELSVTELMERVLVYYRPIFTTRYDDFPKRTQDLESLIEIAGRYDSLSEFLAEITLDPPDSTLSLESSPVMIDSEYLTVSTIHSAKGLEWKVVFLISAVDGYLPSAQSLGDLGQLEEERRLMYVALTRAKDELFIIKPKIDMQGQNYHRFGGIPMSEPSRFLTEGQLLDRFSEKMALEPKNDRPKPSFMASYDSASDDDPIRSKYRF